eukprot:TRINITY_DN7513_c0_g2_i1.p1 TRINITY_DN7513_c0_g2~~TRINITY_DN7513_c0_g2_i1.p1  ORF type:complete len:448 (+),score=-67.54 TRINITY_DN7513_c0_g2_i1:776-2119(+)
MRRHSGRGLHSVCLLLFICTLLMTLIALCYNFNTVADTNLVSSSALQGPADSIVDSIATPPYSPKPTLHNPAVSWIDNLCAATTRKAVPCEDNAQGVPSRLCVCHELRNAAARAVWEVHNRANRDARTPLESRSDQWPCTAARAVLGGKWGEGGAPSNEATSATAVWHPASCALSRDYPLLREQARTALCGRRVQFLGTSRSRYLYLTFVKLLLDGGMPANLKKGVEKSFKGDKCCKPGIKCMNIHLYPDVGDKVTQCDRDHESRAITLPCTLVNGSSSAINVRFTFWEDPLGYYRPNPRQPTIDEYIEKSDVLLLSTIAWMGQRPKKPKCSGPCIQSDLREFLKRTRVRRREGKLKVLYHTHPTINNKNSKKERTLYGTDRLGLETVLGEPDVSGLFVFDKLPSSLGLTMNAATYDAQHFKPGISRIWATMVASLIISAYQTEGQG